MNNLPTEILHNIFIQIHISTKVECMLVCRRWAHVVRESSLFHTIAITEIKMYNKIFKLIREQPWRGAQVRVLTVRGPIPNQDDEEIRLHLFPNLQYLDTHLLLDPRFKNKDPFLMESKAIIPFLNHIEHVKELSGSESSKRILSLGLCRRLTTLDLHKCFSEYSCDFIVTLLVNAPALTNLTMRRFEISINHIEQIHTSLPSLSLFELRAVILTIHQIPKQIQPATSVTSILLDTIKTDMEQKIRFHQYICEKYTHLKHFSYLTERMHYLDNVNLKQLFDRGLAPLLETLGPQLSTLQVTQCIVPDLFEQMDKSSCCIETLRIEGKNETSVINHLVQSSQRHHIHQLELHDVRYYPFVELEQFAHLTTLELVFDYPEQPLCFGRILNSCPETLDTLRIEKLNLKVDRNTHMKAEKSPIKRLILQQTKIRDGLDLFISEHCPHIHSFTLLDCDIDLGIRIQLPELLLSHLHIEPINIYDKSFWRVQTMDSSRKPLLFQVGRNWNSSYFRDGSHDIYKMFRQNGIKDVTAEDVPVNQPINDIFCASLHTLVINNQIVT